MIAIGNRIQNIHERKNSTKEIMNKIPAMGVFFFLLAFGLGIFFCLITSESLKSEYWYALGSVRSSEVINVIFTPLFASFTSSFK